MLISLGYELDHQVNDPGLPKNNDFKGCTQSSWQDNVILFPKKKNTKIM